jgi:RimJ/RimL family protein N-acetyltransferase
MLELRTLEDRDVPLVEAWLEKEHVKPWYEVPELGVSLDDWKYEISERNGEFCWITYLIATWNGSPFGFCQYYKCADSADEDFGRLPIEGSYGIDYMIGEEAYLGKGLGKAMIAMLAERIFTLPDAARVTAEIDTENAGSKHALLSCGFRLVEGALDRYVLEKQP